MSPLNFGNLLCIGVCAGGSVVDGPPPRGRRGGGVAGSCAGVGVGGAVGSCETWIARWRAWSMIS